MPPGSVPPADVILGDAPRAASLLDAVDRLLNVGAVAAGEATISIAGVDLIYLGLNLVLSSVETLQAGAGGPAETNPSPPAGNPPDVPPPGPRPLLKERRRIAPSEMTKPAEAGSEGHTDAGPGSAHERPQTPAAPFTGLGPVSPPLKGRAALETRASAAASSPPSTAPAAAPSLSPAGPWLDLDPDQVEQGLAKLVLTLVEFLRQLLERQAVRRMDGGSLSDEEIERMGAALLQLRAKLWEMAGQFGLRPEDLNLDLGPLGNLL